MYAVFLSGGKQYRVKKNQVIQLEKLNYPKGSIIELKNILMISNKEKTKIGNPFLNGIKVKAYVENHGRSKKIKVLKFNRRKHYRKQQGHRQYFTNVKIIDINHIEN
ncbi:50S ribosomal protein L21 [Buchnera aphidicola (Aphis craccivora)]|uniref:Large ribosomal subunit protein bL21 n=1 Tax=Buchnera aphidicola (Aphis craccivora) TaxID=466616 RepID=A0A4D6XNC2_9GAMM|nr:50S ribosomal protein L21 [Buchnera aphidicola]QCI16627.1 50S ribosomal protein L21 [Buchnera aphidicola (Aphis craccivora)]QLL40761.1 50S ribosomal protein L21 [Buchnera aphidicola (Aphis craccivore)]WAI17600.1 MAG: 50S ribosomal protein L21 [Buchnera aphidicola (Aphis craccivora)]